MKVWVIETGEYAEAFVWGVAASLESAVQSVKDAYRAPYIVRWEERLDQERPCLVGHFAAVKGKSTEHTAVFNFDQAEVIGA